MSAIRVPVLMYHRIGEAHGAWERNYCVSPDRFADHMHALSRTGWHAVSMDDFFSWLSGDKELEEQSFLLTFDDGFLGVYEHAASVLTAKHWCATVFLVTEFLGQQDAWSKADNPSGTTYPLMTAGHVRELRQLGFSFYSHTRSHADLPTLNDQELMDQLAGARDDLQSLLAEETPYLAYPYGRHDDRVIEAARTAGYRAAFSVQSGFNRRDTDRFRLRRLDVFGTDSAAALLRKITLGSNDGSMSASVRYTASRFLARLGIRNL